MIKKLKAIVDLGSLKAKLSVFDKETEHLVNQKSYLTLLGKGISEDAQIIPEALQRLEEAMISIKNELEIALCNEVIFIATESLRIAKNRESVYNLVNKYFPSKDITILDQELEGNMFFKVVARHFPDVDFISMDIGGGSVQIFHGKFDSSDSSYQIYEKHLFKTGTYNLQQKYSPHNDIISTDFHKAAEELKKAYKEFNVKSDVLVFGSTSMQDFLRESKIKLFNNKPFVRHNFYTTPDNLKNLLYEIRKYPPDKRNHFYPSGEYFIYGADYLLINLLEAANKTGARYIYPTNINSSYGFL